MALDLAVLARRWFEEVWNQRRSETIDELMHPDGHGHLEGGEVHGPEHFKALSAELLRAFPDLRVSVEDAIAQGDQVVVRWNATATHTGPALGLTPTGRSVAFRGMTWLIFRDGKVIKGWDAWNQGALFQSLQAP